MRTPNAGDAVHCRKARREEIHLALRIVLGSAKRPADEQQLRDFLQFASVRGIAITEVRVAERRGRIVWAILPITSPGRTVLLLAPSELPAGHDVTPVSQLVESVSSDCTRQGIQLAQVLLDPSDDSIRKIYLSRGFRVMAELLYLQAATSVVDMPPLPAGYSLACYSAALHPAFMDAIGQSYTDSLDCPGLNGLRDMEDVIAGHKASGEHHPGLWFLLRESIGAAPPMPRGVLLLSRTQRGDGMELVYLGLTPAARGRRLGDLLMRLALNASINDGRSVLSLAVDAGNGPALTLYYRHGMQRVGAKMALMRELMPPAQVGAAAAE